MEDEKKGEGLHGDVASRSLLLLFEDVTLVDSREERDKSRFSPPFEGLGPFLGGGRNQARDVVTTRRPCPILLRPNANSSKKSPGYGSSEEACLPGDRHFPLFPLHPRSSSSRLPQTAIHNHCQDTKINDSSGPPMMRSATFKEEGELFQDEARRCPFLRALFLALLRLILPLSKAHRSRIPFLLLRSSKTRRCSLFWRSLE